MSRCAAVSVFYSLADGGDGGRYYDCHRMENMRHAMTILALDMNGKPVSMLHGAPCGCGAKTNLASRWSSGSRRWSPCMTLPTSAPGTAATTKITSSTVTGCQSENGRDNRLVLKWYCQVNLRKHRVFISCAFTARRWIVPCAVVLILAACGGNTHLSFLDPQGPIADAQRWHFYEVLGVMAVLVAAPIFVLLPFWAWRYRYGNKARKYTPRWAHSTPLAIASWCGPIVIVVVLSYFVWRDTHKLDPFKPLASDQAPLRVQVIGYDWKWLFIYPDQGIASVGTLAVPVGRPFSMQLTSATVMQSLFIPALGSQIYAMGGMVTQLNLRADKPGTSMGENTMYNGNGFHQQKFTTVAMPAADFDTWVAKVRNDGIALDAKTVQVIAKQTTRSELIAALPEAKSMDGNVYFNDVGKSLFPAVVKATMNGATTLPDCAFSNAGTSPQYALNTCPSMPKPAK